MAITQNHEPTLTDVIEKLDKLTSNVENLTSEVENIKSDVKHLTSDVERISSEMKRFDELFSDYRQATQWVVQLAFTCDT
ncbi:LPP leucine zipper domain-containing protein [Crocosphaera watsonii WH 8501]|uniref:Uncharacterized protein n=1 Tax=Crocosphaera watsonii WH 8501 TaxID=165597 RepID=Q4C5T5_CROWT|nr:LPP leucine zipper domain-containing protein [Crocosphaera watsonii]EAM51518.1 hypothetical protein CwatDRAFT_4657 [Crocosphaera watsonii WH 8501]